MFVGGYHREVECRAGYYMEGWYYLKAGIVFVGRGQEGEMSLMTTKFLRRGSCQKNMGS
jgi:hypothetical protein